MSGVLEKPLRISTVIVERSVHVPSQILSIGIVIDNILGLGSVARP